MPARLRLYHPPVFGVAVSASLSVKDVMYNDGLVRSDLASLLPAPRNRHKPRGIKEKMQILLRVIVFMIPNQFGVKCAVVLVYPDGQAIVLHDELGSKYHRKADFAISSANLYLCVHFCS